LTLFEVGRDCFVFAFIGWTLGIISLSVECLIHDIIICILSTLILRLYITIYKFILYFYLNSFWRFLDILVRWRICI